MKSDIAHKAQPGRRSFLKSAATALAASAIAPASSLARPKTNVLFIAVDDLRPDLGCYGNQFVRSPHIDRLASEGTTFLRSYCQVAVCGPSRGSLLTGRRPESTGILTNQDSIRDTVPEAPTLTRHFMDQGYHVEGMGKIYHHAIDHEGSWSVPHWASRKGPWYTGEVYESIKRRTAAAKARGEENLSAWPLQLRGPAFEASDVPDEEMRDGEMTNRAIAALRRLKDQPFFLAAGYMKPHLPFTAPKRYWDLYDPNEIGLADNPYPPRGAPPVALTDYRELRSYYGTPWVDKGEVGPELARNLIHGYLACTSFIDAQIGRLLAELDRLGLRDNTAVILFGDHGWQLGEHGLWCKHTAFEVATHAPLIVRAPGQKPGRTRGLTEFVDIYPSLCDLCGVPAPDGLEGTSFAPLIENPDRTWKSAAFSTWPNPDNGNAKPHPLWGRIIGRSMRTDRYRFTEWRSEKNYCSYELYDHETDPDENVNAAHFGANRQLVVKLKKQLDAGWTAAVPS